jgi:hypothetical protein
LDESNNVLRDKIITCNIKQNICTRQINKYLLQRSEVVLAKGEISKNLLVVEIEFWRRWTRESRKDKIPNKITGEQWSYKLLLRMI